MIKNLKELEPLIHERFEEEFGRIEIRTHLLEDHIEVDGGYSVRFGERDGQRVYVVESRVGVMTTNPSDLPFYLTTWRTMELGRALEQLVAAIRIGLVAHFRTSTQLARQANRLLKHEVIDLDDGDEM